MQLNICTSQPNFQIRICGFGFESPDLDLDLDLTIFVKVGFGFGLDLSFFKGADLDLDLDLKIGPDLDLDLDLNIAGFAHHCPLVVPTNPMTPLNSLWSFQNLQMKRRGVSFLGECISFTFKLLDG